MIRKITKKFKRKLKDRDFNEIFTKGISGTAISLIGRFSGFLLIMVITNLYGQEAMGVYTVGLSILSIVGLFGRFGVDMAMSRFVAQYGGAGRWDLIRHTYKISFTIVFVLGLALSAITFFVVPYLTDDLFDPNSPNYDQYTFFMQLFAVTILFYVLGGLSEECIKGLKKTKQYSWISQLVNQVAAIAFLLLFGLFSKDELWVNLSYCLGVFVAFAIAQFYWIYYLKNPEVGGTEFAARKEKRNKKPGAESAAAAVVAIAEQQTPITTGEMIKLSAPMMLAKYLTMIYTWLDILILAWYSPEAMVSIYRVATRLTSLATIPLVSINSIAGPKFAEAYGNNDQRGLRNSVKQATRMIFWTCIPILAVFLIFPKFSLWTFGKDFTGHEAVIVFVIVTLGQAANILTGPVTVLLNMTGRQKVTMYYGLATVVIDVSLNLILIPIYGIIGAAVATSVARTVLNVGCALQIYFTMGISTFYNPFADIKDLLSKRKVATQDTDPLNQDKE